MLAGTTFEDLPLDRACSLTYALLLEDLGPMASRQDAREKFEQVFADIETDVISELGVVPDDWGTMSPDQEQRAMDLLAGL